ncbi:MAG TPA: GDP-fucose synthetase [Gammaproteobacteria bacterium]|nr:GDP-fucose synthetase [Gammaproteobacteria bacterium]
MDNTNTRVFVAGHNGMVGGAICRQLRALGFQNLITRSSRELDLTRQADVEEFFQAQRIEAVYLAAARVGGIHANDTYPAEFIQQNLLIAANVIHAAHMAGVQRLLFLGSSCIYPRLAPQPMREEALLSGQLEPTNEPYAVAKIAGIKLCESYNRQYGRDYRCLMPTNLYGPGDNFHPENSHVIPALIRRFHEAEQSGARQVVVWGSGTPRREFLHVDDLAAACVHVMRVDPVLWREQVHPRCSHVNVGTGEDCTIAELARLVARVVGYSGEVVFDASKPDGAPRKLLDVARLRRMGWQHRIGLEQGLRQAYDWFLAHRHAGGSTRAPVDEIRL